MTCGECGGERVAPRKIDSADLAEFQLRLTKALKLSTSQHLSPSDIDKLSFTLEHTRLIGEHPDGFLFAAREPF